MAFFLVENVHQLDPPIPTDIKYLTPPLDECLKFMFQIEVLGESQMMIPDCARRLKQARSKLSKLLVSRVYLSNIVQ